MSSTPVLAEIRFYRATGEHGFLSNLYPGHLIFEGKRFECAEYAYQFGKPADPKIAEWLMTAPTPSLCAQVAHSLFPWQVRPDWSQIKVDRMRAVLRAKFRFRPVMIEMLLATGDAVLIEDSKTDAFWGVGKKGSGRNMLGELLMQVRQELRGGRQTGCE